MGPRIRTTLVGSYPLPAWLAAMPGKGALRDATAVVLKTQENAGIDMVVDGELYRFDINHPETNGMIEYFVRPMSGVRNEITREDKKKFSAGRGMKFRARPSAVVESKLTAGTLDLPEDCRRARELTASPYKFTLTGPHMLSKTLLDNHYGSRQELCRALAVILAEQVRDIQADVIQIDEANITGNPQEAEWAAECINTVLAEVQTIPAMHLCFGNYGGQTIQKGRWQKLIGFIEMLHCEHILVETAHRPSGELKYLAEVASDVRYGVGVIDIKSTVVETPEVIARRIEAAAKVLGPERIAYVNPDCGFWMLDRSIADRKIEALVAGRNLYEGR
jgi:5-methyltetrahydropteroyltriglutamate--homocysteine methyltransferase